MNEQCLICRVSLPQENGHKSPWSFVPHDTEDLHLRRGNLMCCECHVHIWGAVQLALKNALRSLKNCRDGTQAKVMPKNMSALDMEAIFKKVVKEEKV